MTILSISRRTDIPAFYTDWLKYKFDNNNLVVGNNKIDLSPTNISGIVFWTKDASKIINCLDTFSRYAYYFQYTLNCYGKDIEPNIPENRVDTFKRLAEMLGSYRVIWRYDPIFITNDKYTLNWHINNFGRTADMLKGYTNKCVFSFIDLYPSIKYRMSSVRCRVMSTDEMSLMVKSMSEIAKRNGLVLETCAEKINLEEYGISHGRCIDTNIFEIIHGTKMKYLKDRSQRKECGCTDSVDIGEYNTCKGGCLYCYATHREQLNTKYFDIM